MLHFFGSPEAGTGIALDKGGDGMKEKKLRIRWRSALLGLGVGVAAMTGLTALGAWLMVRGMLDIGWMDWWAAGALTASGLLGGFAARLDGGGAIDGALAASGELVVLLVLNLILCDGQMEGLAVTALVLAGGSGAAALLGMDRGRGHRRRRR